jgi:hypothetical protein
MNTTHSNWRIRPMASALLPICARFSPAENDSEATNIRGRATLHCVVAWIAHLAVQILRGGEPGALLHVLLMADATLVFWRRHQQRYQKVGRPVMPSPTLDRALVKRFGARRRPYTQRGAACSFADDVAAVVGGITIQRYACANLEVERMPQTLKVYSTRYPRSRLIASVADRGARLRHTSHLRASPPARHANSGVR